MAADWQILPPWSSEQGPIAISPGSPIRNDFEIVKHHFDSEMTTSLHWTGLSRGDLANLRSLADSKDLGELLRSHNCGFGWGASVDTKAEDDPNDAEFDLMIDSIENLPGAFMSEIVSFVKSYRVE